MGLRDKLKASIDKTKETVDKVKNDGINEVLKGVANEVAKNVKDNNSKKNEILQKNAEIAKLVKTHFTIVRGAEQLKIRNEATMIQKSTGEIFFNINENDFYSIIDYSWSGPQYNTITHSQTIGEEITKGKAGRVITGGLIGSIAAPLTAGASILVGAGAGAVSKGRKNSVQNTTSTTNQVEINTPATIKLKNLQTNQVVGISIVCNSYIDSDIKRFALSHEANNIPIESTETSGIEINANDPYEEIKKAKELLDMGIITQEEFDLKKKELLGLQN